MPDNSASFEQDRLILQELVRRSNNDSRRLKELEQRFDALDTKTKTIESTVLKKHKDLESHFVEIEARVREMEERLMGFQSAFDRFNRQVTKFAMRRDIKELEHMFELFNPVTGKFVTVDELENKLRELKETFLTRR